MKAKAAPKKGAKRKNCTPDPAASEGKPKQARTTARPENDQTKADNQGSKPSNMDAMTKRQQQADHNLVLIRAVAKTFPDLQPPVGFTAKFLDCIPNSCMHAVLYCVCVCM